MKLFYTTFILSFFILSTPMLIAQPSSDYTGYQFKNQLNSKRGMTSELLMTTEESNERSDTLDITNYNITLDITDFSARRIDGNCEISMISKFDGVSQMKLDLLALDIDSIMSNNQTLSYDYDGDFITIYFAEPLNTGETQTVNVYYGGQPTVAASNFGGLAFDGNYAYNLGIGLGENPYNFGRGWFPCFDNFVERSTFDLNIITSNGRKAYCVGNFLEELDLGDGKIMRRYRMDQPITTYLVGVAVSTYSSIDYIHEGAYEDVPIQLVGQSSQLSDMQETFEYLGDAIDAMEAWFGPHAFDRVGFVLTPRGAMEHATNIAYPISLGTGGPTFAGNRLMSHELAHHWWGNVTTLSSPANMWIKEGNAEYSAHLFTEYVFGKEAFIDQVKDNHLGSVLKNAHVDDDGFLPLSGIPYEHTYGTHTYRKGAAMMHNLRTYLGDTLFQKGMSSMLEEYKFDAIDAAQFENHLIQSTGIDVLPFMNAWIYNPGYSNFEVDDYDFIENNDGTFEAAISIQQKLRAAPNFHQAVPLVMTFYNDDWETTERHFMASDEFTNLQFTLPFEPTFMVINQDQGLNMGRIQHQIKVTEVGDIDRSYIDFLNFTALAVPDSALVNVVHHWTAPDPSSNPYVRMSSTHYWSVGGIIPEGFEMKGTLVFSGPNEDRLDYDLVGEGSDSLVLMWRPTIFDEWEEYADYSRLGGTGSSGFLRVDPMLPGDYAFANADFPVSTKEILDPTTISVFPNPTTNLISFEGNLKTSSEVLFSIADLNGKVLEQRKQFLTAGYFSETFLLTNYPTGVYNCQLIDEKGQMLATKKIAKIE